MPQPKFIEPDVLLVVWDDCWAGELTEERTPNAWALAADSRVYTRCYSHPVCWHSRASLTWGRYGRHFTPPIIEAMGVTSGPEPEAGRPTLAGEFALAGYSTCLVGKWHRGRNPGTASGPTAFLGAPQARGYQSWLAGAPSNLGSWSQPWERVDGTTIVNESEYATKAQAAAAVSWWNSTEGPKLLEFSLSAPHPPFHSPPSELLGGYEPDSMLPTGRKNYERMVRSADWALGQMLGEVDDETIIVLCSDNGCPVLPPGAPAGHGKATTFEYGIRVPLSIRSWHTPGVSDRLVHLVDLPATLLQLAGLPAQPSFSDSCSLVGSERGPCLSEALMNDGGSDVHDRAAMTRTHKLRRVDNGPEELYDLEADPNELSPLDVNDPTNASVLAELRNVLG